MVPNIKVDLLMVRKKDLEFRKIKTVIVMKAFSDKGKKTVLLLSLIRKEIE